MQWYLYDANHYVKSFIKSALQQRRVNAQILCTVIIIHMMTHHGIVLALWM